MKDKKRKLMELEKPIDKPRRKWVAPPADSRKRLPSDGEESKKRRKRAHYETGQPYQNSNLSMVGDSKTDKMVSAIEEKMKDMEDVIENAQRVIAARDAAEAAAKRETA